RGDRGLHVRLAELLRQEGLDDGDFLAFLRGKLRPVALVVEARRLLALLDHLGEQLGKRTVAYRASPLSALGDVAVLDRGLDHAERADAARILGKHRLLQGGVDLLAHGSSSTLDKRRELNSGSVAAMALAWPTRKNLPFGRSPGRPRSSSSPTAWLPKAS